MPSIGNRIRSCRKERGLSQRALSNLIIQAGEKCDERQISDYEMGKVIPRLEKIIALAKSLQTTTSYLAGEIDFPGSAEEINRSLKANRRRSAA